MNLYVDVGNTTVNFAIDDGEKIEKVLTVLTRDFDRRKLSIRGMLLEYKVDRVYISSVCPECYQSLYKIMRKTFKKDQIIQIDPLDPVSFKVDIEFPKELGTDLLCDLEGAATNFKGGLIIIDVGTATKVILLSIDKVFSSCVIIPGLGLSFEILNNKTSLLPLEQLREPKNYLDCHNTHDVIVSSVVYSNADAIKGAVERYEKEIGYKTKKIITGGYGEFMKKYLDFDTIFEPDLIFLGMRSIARKK